MPPVQLILFTHKKNREQGYFADVVIEIVSLPLICPRPAQFSNDLWDIWHFSGFTNYTQFIMLRKCARKSIFSGSEGSRYTWPQGGQQIGCIWATNSLTEIRIFDLFSIFKQTPSFCWKSPFLIAARHGNSFRFPLNHRWNQLD